MTIATHRSVRYNITLSQLFRRIIGLSEEQQREILDHITEHFPPEEDSDPRRSQVRKSCLMTVDCLLGGRVVRNYVHDISMGGMFIETSTPLEVGQEMTLVFSFFENRAPFKVKGRVAWSSPQGAGIQFVQLSPFQQNVLKTTVDRLNAD